jgi:hypothetical protein
MKEFFGALQSIGNIPDSEIGRFIRTINYFDKNTESMVYSVTYYSDGVSIT